MSSGGYDLHDIALHHSDSDSYSNENKDTFEASISYKSRQLDDNTSNYSN